MRQARKPHHDPAPRRAGGCRRLLRFAERGAGRDAPSGAVRARHAGKYRPLSAGRPVHRRLGRRAAGGLLHPALLRAGRAQLCRLHGHPQTRVGRLGQRGQRHRPSRLPGQRPAAEAAGSSPDPAPPRHRGHRGDRQPRQPVQPPQRPRLRLRDRLPPGDVRRL